MKQAQSGAVFQRIEKKYLLSPEKYLMLGKSLAPYICMDDYGRHSILNIYYDTDTYDLIRHSIEKPPYKEKLRLRSYGIPKAGDTVYLELKKKWRKTVYKRRVALPLCQAEAYLAQGRRPEADSQILREIDYFLDFYRPEPRLFLAYDRIACFGVQDPSLRVTFDANIRSRRESLDLSAGDWGSPLLSKNEVLMEIKIPGAMPLWLSAILSDLEIYPTSFSKYGNIYKQDIIQERSQTLCSQAF
ncbi:MAG: polyphosphate polymerase domain-containing protein [Eubacterium sp.]|nr:polyphosphate polymerase domain-containing protein [Eubacterium sp.]